MSECPLVPPVVPRALSAAPRPDTAAHSVGEVGMEGKGEGRKREVRKGGRREVHVRKGRGREGEGGRERAGGREGSHVYIITHVVQCAKSVQLQIVQFWPRSHQCSGLKCRCGTCTVHDIVCIHVHVDCKCAP